jgi:hypothetical protein
MILPARNLIPSSSINLPTAAIMDRLPQEVFDLIIQNVDFPSLPSRRAHYATISRQWQCAIEQRLFASLTVWCHEMSMLEYILLDSRRRGYLDVLRYDIAGTFRNRKAELSFGIPQTTYCQLNYELKQLWNFLSLYWVGRPRRILTDP